MNPYPALESACLPLMRGYQTDLTKHDRSTIDANPECPFLHYTSALNTLLVELKPPGAYPSDGVMVSYIFGTADREHILKQNLNLTDVQWQSRRDVLAVHHWNGKLLRKIDIKEARFIMEGYVASVRHAWEMEQRRHAGRR